VKARLGRRWDQLSQNGIKEIIKTDWELSAKRSYRLEHIKREFPVRIPAEVFADTELDDTSREPHIKQGRILLKG
jgi:hypothetical protein